MTCEKQIPQIYLHTHTGTQSMGSTYTSVRFVLNILQDVASLDAILLIETLSIDFRSFFESLWIELTFSFQRKQHTRAVRLLVSAQFVLSSLHLPCCFSFQESLTNEVSFSGQYLKYSSCLAFLKLSYTPHNPPKIRIFHVIFSFILVETWETQKKELVSVVHTDYCVLFTRCSTH